MAFITARTGRFKTEVIRSRQTTDWKAADRKALAHIEEAHRLVEQARAFLRDGFPEEITREQVDRLVREHEIDLLERDEKLRFEGVGPDLGRVTIRPDGRGMTDDDLAFAWKVKNAPTPERGPEPSKATISSALKRWADGGGRGAKSRGRDRLRRRSAP